MLMLVHEQIHALNFEKLVENLSRKEVDEPAKANQSKQAQRPARGGGFVNSWQ